MAAVKNADVALGAINSHQGNDTTNKQALVVTNKLLLSQTTTRRSHGIPTRAATTTRPRNLANALSVIMASIGQEIVPLGRLGKKPSPRTTTTVTTTIVKTPMLQSLSLAALCQ